MFSRVWAAIVAALFAALLLFIPCRIAAAQDSTATAATTAYSRNPDGSYTVTLTFLDGKVLTFPATEKVTSPPPASGAGLTFGGASFYAVGASLPWFNYGTDVGTGAWGKPTDWNAIDQSFAAVSAAGGRLIRLWLFADGRYSPEFDSAGKVTGLDTQALPDVDHLLSLAAKNDVYLLLTVLDGSAWDAPKTVNGVVEGGHRALVLDAATRASYINLALKPLLQRVVASPNKRYVLGYDLVNEPERNIQNLWGGTGIPLAAVQSWVKDCAATVHSIHPGALVTVGSATPAWTANWKGLGLDFYQAHYYPPMDGGGVPGSGLPAYNTLGLDKPCLIGEFPTAAANYTPGSTTPLSAQWYLDTIRSRGYAGALAWSVRAGDAASNWSAFTPVYKAWAAGATFATGPPKASSTSGGNTGGGTDTTPVPVPPAAPANFAGSFIATKGVLLSWDVAPGVDHYVLHRSIGGADPESLPPFVTIRPVAGVAQITYADSTALPGAAQTMYRYCPAAVLADGTTGPCSPDVMITVPAAATTPPVDIPPSNLPKLGIEQVYPNDDSVVIEVTPYPGAADYLVYDSANPNDVKASGGNALLEWNGYPVKGKLIVQALSQLAPYHPHVMAGMTASAGPGPTVTNGHGATGNKVTPIAQSDPITPVYKLLTPTPGATQIALDTFHDGATVNRIGDDKTFLRFNTSNGNWKGEAFAADFAATDPMFISHAHGMWLFRPGMTPGQGPTLQQNGTVTWEMLHGIADISGGKVAHFSIECDSHFPLNRRRWLEIAAIPADDQVVNFENMDVLNNGGVDFSLIKPTTSGNLFLWSIDGGSHQPILITWENGHKVLNYVAHILWSDPAGAGDRFGPCLRGSADGGATHPYLADGTTLNGGIKDLDLRHRYDIYLSQTHLRLFEADARGVRVLILDRDLPKTLPFTRLRWVVDGKVYHPDNDGVELSGEDKDWYWTGPFNGIDVRHLDNALSEVLSAFPSLN